MTRAGALREAASRLAAAGIEGPEREARLLLRWAAGLDAAALATRLDETPGCTETARFHEAVTRRAGRVPLSHVTGLRAFWRHDFIVTPAVLDPRPETEVLVAWALEGSAPESIVDLGTGTGCILLSLLAEWPRARGLGIDASAEALGVAQANAAALGLSGRADFRHGNWLEDVAGPVDLVVSNPPYLATAELAGLTPEVLAEPRAALDGGPDGLEPYRRIAARLGTVLAPGGTVLLEIGPTQAEAVSSILIGAGLPCVAVRADLDGRPRVVRASRRL